VGTTITDYFQQHSLSGLTINCATISKTGMGITIFASIAANTEPTY